MAKNSSFKNVYQVTVSGRCTNGFMAKVIDKLLLNLIDGLSRSNVQTNITMEVVSTKGDYNALTGITEGDR